MKVLVNGQEKELTCIYAQGRIDISDDVIFSSGEQLDYDREAGLHWRTDGPYKQSGYAEILMNDAKKFVEEMQEMGLTYEQATEGAIKLYRQMIYYTFEREN